MNSLNVVDHSVTEEKICDIVFDACRGNAARAEWTDGVFSVVFFAIGDGDHYAVVRKNGAKVGTAIVDPVDC